MDNGKAVEYGLIAALIAVVIVTGVTAVQERKHPTTPPPQPHCPSGTLYVDHLGVCLAGASVPTFK